jgi:hypothetical protein
VLMMSLDIIFKDMHLLFSDWVSFLAYPNLYFGIKGFVVIVVVVVVVSISTVKPLNYSRLPRK